MVTIQGRQPGDFSHGNHNSGSFNKVTITLHYHRYDGDYEGWNLWVWLDGQSGRMVEFVESPAYGRSATFTMEEPTGINRVGFIIRKSTVENDWASKRFDDRFITSFDQNGYAEAWLMQGMERIYHSANEVDVSPGIISAEQNSWQEIQVKTNLAFDWDHDNIAVNLEGATIQDIRISKDHYDSDLAHQLTIITKEKLTLSDQYRVAISHFGYCDVTYGEIVRTKEFDDEFSYSGTLGAIYSEGGTLFRLWAPSASEAAVVIYPPSPDKEPILNVMEKGPKGTWSIQLNGNLHETAYMFKVKIGKYWHEAVDPYARAVTVNGEKGVVVNLAQTNPVQWTSAKPPLANIEDAIIYELHVRDASIHPNSGIQHKGKFLGLTETNTETSDGISTGLRYIKELGVTHVQLLPIYDFWTVDETRLATPQYNWGYDPKHYNAPDGSYSTDPYKPCVRIMELKQMIQTMHDQGLRVIMDVVYNHVYDAARSSFQQLVPGYYFRYTEEGWLSNGTGVGNDTASERSMMRKFIVDSLVYWATEYHLDGFRFDLMGIHDVDTMNEIRKALDSIDPAIIILGEGWDLHTALPGEKKANQYNAHKMQRIGHFNDSIRDHLKGNNFSDRDNGFVNGKSGLDYIIKQGITAGMKFPYERPSYTAPNQVVNYVEAHDNHTLWDKLCLTNPQASQEDLKAMHKLATSVVLLSQGISFLHAGQEFMRTKNGEHNSYRSPDRINQLDWDRRAEFAQEVDYIKGLIQLRKSFQSFRMRTLEQVQKFMHFYQTIDRVIAYRLDAHGHHDPAAELMVVHNARDVSVTIPLESDGPWHVLVNGTRAGIESLSIIKRDSIEVPRYGTYVLMRK
ncbi:type I pullulanase [Jeotgalibacillus soli]|uniref:pullulanase n=1 Tax=Jeotgalibacillus soli TaxID=889306 RepID=A0A0C2RPD6_9BACL|nr:type I pullulanase [Jeotgalibacillus soli]KIL52115.1 pullulanase [Jeotgalibacillus soli]